MKTLKPLILIWAWLPGLAFAHCIEGIQQCVDAPWHHCPNNQPCAAAGEYYYQYKAKESVKQAFSQENNPGKIFTVLKDQSPGNPPDAGIMPDSLKKLLKTQGRPPGYEAGATTGNREPSPAGPVKVPAISAPLNPTEQALSPQPLRTPEQIAASIKSIYDDYRDVQEADGVNDWAKKQNIAVPPAIEKVLRYREGEAIRQLKLHHEKLQQAQDVINSTGNLLKPGLETELERATRLSGSVMDGR